MGIGLGVFALIFGMWYIIGEDKERKRRVKKMWVKWLGEQEGNRNFKKFERQRKIIEVKSILMVIVINAIIIGLYLVFVFSH